MSFDFRKSRQVPLYVSTLLDSFIDPSVALAEVLPVCDGVVARPTVRS